MTHCIEVHWKQISTYLQNIPLDIKSFNAKNFLKPISILLAEMNMHSGHSWDVPSVKEGIRAD